MIVVVTLRDLIGLGLLGFCGIAFAGLWCWYAVKRRLQRRK